MFSIFNLKIRFYVTIHMKIPVQLLNVWIPGEIYKSEKLKISNALLHSSALLFDVLVI